MGWDAIGASAEAIGAIAVLLTLVYLAIQTRDNVRVQKARAIWDAQQSFVEVNELLGDGGRVSDLVYKAAAGQKEFSDYEHYLLHRFVRGWFQRLEAQFALYRAGILDNEDKGQQGQNQTNNKLDFHHAAPPRRRRTLSRG